jgi:transposase
MAPSRSICRARTDAKGEWTPERLRRQAQGIVPNTEALIIAVMARRPHPEQGFRTRLGVLRLFRRIDATRVEAVSLRAVEIGALSYALHRFDPQTPSQPRGAPQAADGTPLLHANIRGPRYYQIGDAPCSLIPRSTCCMTSA